MDPIVSLHHIAKTFKEKPGHDLAVLERINLEIFPGEFFIFLGPSGSGKSTLLRIMSGLEKDYHGSVEWARDVVPSDMSFVFQQAALLPWLTAAENVEMGLVGQSVPMQERATVVTEELRELGLEGFRSAYPHELSGGMRQRVGIARAIATNPKVIFMDEPFSEVDSFTARVLRRELLEIWQKRKPTIIMVTHLIQEAIELADRIAVLTPRPGSIEQIVENKMPRPRDTRSHESYHLEDKLYAIIKP